jgi:hypothetical protein
MNGFVKYVLKGVLKCIRVKIGPTYICCYRIDPKLPSETSITYIDIRINSDAVTNTIIQCSQVQNYETRRILSISNNMFSF